MTRNPQVSRLANGVRVASLRLPGRAGAGAVIAWRAGVQAEGPGEAGLAHLAEHVLFPDNPRDLATFDAMGGQFNAWSAPEYTLFHAHTPAPQLTSALTLFSRHLARGADLVNEGVFHREREIIRRERFTEGDTALELALALCLKIHPPLAEGISDQATPGALRNFIERELHGESLCVGVAGDIDHVDVLKACNPLGNLHAKSDQSVSTICKTPAWFAGLREHIADGGPPGLLWLLPSPPRGSIQGDALAVAERALCGGLNAPLFRELRSQGLAYGLHSVHERWTNGGFWALQVICLPAARRRVSALLHTAMNEALTQFSEGDLDAAWSSLAASTQLEADNPISIAGQLAISGLFGAPTAPAMPARPTLSMVRTALVQAWKQHTHFTIGEYIPSMSHAFP